MLRTTRLLRARAADTRVLLIGSGLVAGPVVELLSARAGVAVTIGLTPPANLPPLSHLLFISGFAGSMDQLGAQRLAQRNSRATAVPLNASDPEELGRAVAAHDIVISLVPAGLHPNVAQACIAHRRNMVTSSYISPKMAALDSA